jgi:dTDP-4-amino-4,6-dideoxygalactose transaminase
MTVPFLDLQASYASIKPEIQEAIQRVLDSAAYALGPSVAAFESDFAAYCDVDHGVAVGNGTEALWIALKAVGVGPGTEVITVPNTFIATAEAIDICGAQTVLVDVDDATLTMNPLAFEAAITPRTRAVIPVHLFGQPANMGPITLIAREHGISVIEDACQAHGARYDQRRCGSLGDVACFSFYPGKNLGAYGEGGALVTNHRDIADFARSFRDHGQPKKHAHEFVGWNARMDGIQGAVLGVKLKHLEAWTAARRRIAKRYNVLLEAIPAVRTPTEAYLAYHVYHLYVVRVPERDRVSMLMRERGVQTGVHYPVPLHRTPAFTGRATSAGPLTVAERAANEVLSLPMYPDLTEAQIFEVVDALQEALVSIGAGATL